LNGLKKIRHTLPCRTEFPSLITHGNTPKKALKEIELAVAESIKWIEE
jgi:predicted RNase H-like HicB family nuclease